MRNPFTLIKHLWTRLMAKPASERRERREYQPNQARPSRCERLSRYDKMVAWCAAFNHRQGYIVPSKSPESIYRKAMRAR